MHGLPEKLARMLHLRLRELVETEAIGAAELHHKFLQDPHAFTLRFGELSAFFGGLEKKIGSPDPNVRDAMEREHTMAADSNKDFTTPNYEVTTKPEIEWSFVVEPTQNVEWPIEKKLEPPAVPRTPLSMRQLESLLRQKNEELERVQAAHLLLEEAIGARLYTGPM